MTNPIDFWLLDLYYEMNREEEIPEVHMIGFDKDNNKIEIIDDSERPYLYAYKESPYEIKGAKVTIIEKLEGLNPRTVFRYEGTNPRTQIMRWAEELQSYGIKTAETGIYFTQVYMKDKGIVPSTWNKLEGKFSEEENISDELSYALYGRVDRSSQFKGDIPKLRLTAFDTELPSLDIEKDGFLMLFLATERKSNPIDMTINYGKGDKVALERFAENVMIEKPDIVFNYSGNTSDYLWIKERERINNIELALDIFGTGSVNPTEHETMSIKGRSSIDLIGYGRVVSPKNAELYVVHKALRKMDAVPKRDYKPIDRTRMGEIWNSGSEGKLDIINHCRSDVICTLDIGKAALPFAVQQSRICNIPLDQIFDLNVTSKIEGMIMRYASKRNMIIPDREDREYKKIKGAVVFEPDSGVQLLIASGDFSSMYPNIVISKNISPETLFKVFENLSEKSIEILSKKYNLVVSDQGKVYAFLKEPIGLFAEAMKDLLNDIEEAKTYAKKYTTKYSGEVQGLKGISRSMYGQMLFIGSRWFDRDSGEAIPADGRNKVRSSSDELRNLEYKVKYGDTDSIFFKLKDKKHPKEEAEKVLKEVSEKIGAPISLDKVYLKMFFTEAKKKYAGLLPDGSVDIVGFETVRGDWCFLARHVQDNVIKFVLLRGYPVAKRYAEFVLKNIEKYPLRSFIIKKKVGQKSYSARQPHAEVAKRVGIPMGSDVEYVIVNGNKILSERARHVSEVKDTSQIDFDYYKTNQVGALARRVLDYFGKELEDMNYVGII